MEYSATWSTDSRNKNFPIMGSGINAGSIDFAKFGRLVMNSGLWENDKIVSPAWISKLTTSFNPTKQYYSEKTIIPIQFSLMMKDSNINLDGGD
jgi:hypothetical protein